jgi:TRAP-type mannitol/chloroaromatic compound transport system permease small subunit
MTWIVTLMIAIGFLNVVGRYVGRFLQMRLSSNAFIEIQWYMFSVLFFLGFAYIMKHNLNVRVDFWYAKQNPKRQAWVDLLGHVLFFVAFCIIGIAVAYGPVLRSWGLLRDGSWGNWEMSPDPDGLPRAPIKSMIIVSFVLLLIQTFSEVIKQIGVITGAVRPETLNKNDNHELLAE